MSIKLIEFKEELLDDLRKRIKVGKSVDGFSIYDNWKHYNYKRLRSFEMYCDSDEHEHLYDSLFRDACMIYKGDKK